MITLITGSPGAGKTAWLISQLLELRKNEPNREVFIHGIRNFRGFLHDKIYCKSQLCDICRGDEDLQNAEKKGEFVRYVENWHEWKITGALIVVDEVQRIWRPRAGGAQPPASVSGLETHRHYGLDFWLISQGPHLFDNFIRLLVGRHIHLLLKWNGRKQYEWPECKQDVSSRFDAVERPYTLPKHVFKMYDSAEVHTKLSVRKPLSFYAAVACIPIFIISGYFFYSRMQERIYPTTNKPVLVSSSAAPPVISNQSGFTGRENNVKTNINKQSQLSELKQNLYDGLSKDDLVNIPTLCTWDTKKIVCDIKKHEKQQYTNVYCYLDNCKAVFFYAKQNEGYKPPDSAYPG